MTRKKKPQPQPEKPKSPPPLTGAELTRAAFEPALRSAFTAADYCSHFGKMDTSEAVCELRRQTKAIREGDTTSIETTLAAQANALDAIFAHMARRASVNAGEYLGAMETYLKLALRAQSQCRATLETLATIKNPPVVFAKQANIAHGHQQVNNGEGVPLARAGETANPQTELLEPPYAKPEWMDAGTTRAATPSNPPLEAVAAIDRSKDRKG